MLLLAGTAAAGLLLLLLLPALVALRSAPYLWADAAALAGVLLASLRCEWRLVRRPPVTLLDVFQAHVRRQPRRPLLLFQDELYTYEDVERRSARVARALERRLALCRGQVVAVFLPNCPTYVWTWLALAKLGCTMACLNSNARGRVLRHALAAARTTVMLTSPDLQAAVEEVLPDLQQDGIHVFYLSDESPTAGVEALGPSIKAASDDPLPAYYRADITPDSKAIYIFTSGTTGATCVLRAKFSASQFWDDCRHYNVTVIQYVGELMRYLCNTPKRPGECNHNVRMAVGNGMRAEVWKEFLQRFGPITIREFYGATEGNAGFMNYTGKIGAVGRANVFLKKLAPFELIRYDVEQDEPIRDERGFCIPVRPGEAGLLVIKVTKKTPFHGYAGDPEKTEKKILRNVLVKDDVFFNSGDLLMMDHEKFLYFQDRVGDTFRWKGENVATTEVENTLATVNFIQEINVYGVSVPGCEGKCGMAAIRLKPGMSFEGESLYVHAKDCLPSYATPRFVRLQEALEITGTFKQCKGNLVKEGFNPNIIKDPLFFLDEMKKSYVPLSPDIYTDILETRLKL
ncbi:long-chain fatty acid transport protein 5 isoform X2 [Rhea pennata]|uniref:long-chain fatty acid transport protein 5 isoform X2 n=1 Tax=Rhea pennata TaxID=8795 RepID=UPI002E268156